MLSKKYASAAKAYERSYAIRKSGNLAAQIHQAHLRAGKPEQGEAVVLSWLQEKPTDARTRQYLADSSMKSSRLAVAVPQYEWLAQNQPGNQQVLNNLAWAYSEIADARAVAVAEKAFKINEINPAAADTYGWILYRNARVSEAVDMLRRAVELAPNSRDIRYHYAQALAKAGDRKNARVELERVLAGTTPFANQAEAKALLAQLKS
jgi:Flp pilus assembly protein TadD